MLDLGKERIMRKLFLLVLPLLLIVGCSSPEPINYETTLVEREGVFYTKDTNKPYSGLVFSLDKKGRTKREGILEDGKMISYTGFKWYENGQMKRKGIYIDEKENGLWTEWYENGQKKFDFNYKDGERDGLSTYWFETGLKYSERNYKDGKENGLWIEWYENGQKKVEGTFVDGYIVGPGKKWNEDGSVKQ
tara:strand:+ start:46 stop:618 length:573 start_codon:yes stop_codon:yes gene_type:complete